MHNHSVCCYHREVYPPNLPNLYATSNCGLSYSELLKKCQELHAKVIQEQADCADAQTRDRAAWKEWCAFRSGRITASKMKQACRTNPDQLWWSLVQSVCYLTACKLSTAATKWVCSYEDNTPGLCSEDDKPTWKLWITHLRVHHQPKFSPLRCLPWWEGFV